MIAVHQAGFDKQSRNSSKNSKNSKGSEKKELEEIKSEKSKKFTEDLDYLVKNIEVLPELSQAEVLKLKERNVKRQWNNYNQNLKAKHK